MLKYCHDSAVYAFLWLYLLHCVSLSLQMLCNNNIIWFCSVCRLTFVLRRWGTMWGLLLLSWETSMLLLLRYINCISVCTQTYIFVVSLSLWNCHKILRTVMSLIHLFFFLLQLLTCVRKDGWKYPSDTEWWNTLKDKIAANAKISKVGLDSCISYILFRCSIVIINKVSQDFCPVSLHRHLLCSQHCPWTTTQCFTMSPSCCHMTA